jgi:uroporphyrin-III C-methyltransferase
VHLVGAGPGDPELLTLKAARVLGRADVVLLDDLVDRRVLHWIRPGARLVEVGKRGGCKSTPQQFIERLLVREALAGRRVVRLKGGDPFVFGRGGEEISALAAAGIDVEVVPGITAGVAAPAVAGIPVTDRRHAQGVIFVTGHSADPAHEPDWDALARSGLTLVVYMGVSRCAAISARLIEGGLAADTPAAAIQHAYTPRQKALVSTVARLAADIAAARLGSPAIIVIGRVVSLARECSITADNRGHESGVDPVRARRTRPGVAQAAG